MWRLIAVTLVAFGMGQFAQMNRAESGLFLFLDYGLSPLVSRPKRVSDTSKRKAIEFFRFSNSSID